MRVIYCLNEQKVLFLEIVMLMGGLIGGAIGLLIVLVFSLIKMMQPKTCHHCGTPKPTKISKKLKLDNDGWICRHCGKDCDKNGQKV
jgi:hypothetical protein